MAPPIAPYLTAFSLLVTVATAATGYRNHTVGGSVGWSFNSTTNTSATNYTAWATSQTFALGDFLIFNTNSNQTVIQTYNRTVYLNCSADDSDNGTFVYNGGNGGFGLALTIDVPLTIVGPNYFFSDAGDGVQCQQGLAFEIDVQRGLGLPPSLNQPPPPPYIEPPGPDTAQSPPITGALPPSGGSRAACANVRVAIYGFAAALLLLQYR